MNKKKETDGVGTIIYSFKIKSFFITENLSDSKNILVGWLGFMAYQPL